MYQLVLTIHILAAFCILALVLVQQGKGAAIGAAFGSGASQTVFGSRGSGSFLLRLTIGFAVVFFATSLALNYIAGYSLKQQSTLDLPVTGKEVPELPVPGVSPNSIPAIPGNVGQPLGNVK